MLAEVGRASVSGAPDRPYPCRPMSHRHQFWEREAQQRTHPNSCRAECVLTANLAHGRMGEPRSSAVRRLRPCRACLHDDGWRSDDATAAHPLLVMYPYPYQAREVSRQTAYHFFFLCFDPAQQSRTGDKAAGQLCTKPPPDAASRRGEPMVRSPQS